MAFLFGSGQNVARSEDVRTACTLMRQWRERQLDEKDVKKISELLALMKLTLQGTQERDADIVSVGALVQAIVENDLLMGIASTIHLFPFEARKDAQIVFTLAVRYRADPDPEIRPPAIEHIITNRPEVISQLCSCYDHKSSIVQCGNMLREAIKQKDMVKMILYDEPLESFHPERIDDQRPSNGQGLFWKFFHWVEAPNFEISADAFTTFRGILTFKEEKKSDEEGLVPHWLGVNFDLFFNRYADTLICSRSYVTKRQSIKLLGEVLLERRNYSVMTRFVDNPEYLKMCMNLLRDDRKMVQYEGFHVFKIFVANPNKSFPVQKILINNRDKLLRFLPNFLSERTEDGQFNEEKAFIIQQIKSLPAQPVDRPGDSGASTGY